MAFGLGGVASGFIATKISGHFWGDNFIEGFIFGFIGAISIAIFVNTKIFKRIFLILTGGVGFGIGYALTPWLIYIILPMSYLIPFLGSIFYYFLPRFLAGVIYMSSISYFIEMPKRIILWSGLIFSIANLTAIFFPGGFIFHNAVYGIVGGAMLMARFYFFEKSKNVNPTN